VALPDSRVFDYALNPSLASRFESSSSPHPFPFGFPFASSPFFDLSLLLLPMLQRYLHHLTNAVVLLREKQAPNNGSAPCGLTSFEQPCFLVWVLCPIVDFLHDKL
jgi:hypothetical protein